MNEFEEFLAPVALPPAPDLIPGRFRSGWQEPGINGTDNLFTSWTVTTDSEILRKIDFNNVVPMGVSFDGEIIRFNSSRQTDLLNNVEDTSEKISSRLIPGLFIFAVALTFVLKFSLVSMMATNFEIISTPFEWVIAGLLSIIPSIVVIMAFKDVSGLVMDEQERENSLPLRNDKIFYVSRQNCAGELLNNNRPEVINLLEKKILTLPAPDNLSEWAAMLLRILETNEEFPISKALIDNDELQKI